MRRTALASVLLVLFPVLSQAQPRGARPGAPPAAPAPGVAPAGAATAPVEIPPPPKVDDPMLAPMPPAPREIATWEQALDLIRARSTDLRRAYDQILQAEAQTRVALAAALPTIQGNGSVTHQLITNNITSPAGVAYVVNTVPGVATPVPFGSVSTTVPTANSYSGSITLAQPLLAAEAWHNIRTNEIGEKAARLSYDDIKRTIALGVADALIGVVTAERIAELNRVGFRNALQQLDIVQKRRALGAPGVTALDVLRAQTDVENARATLVTGDESLRQAREALGIALGLPQQIGVTRDLNLNGLVQSALDVCKAAPSIEERADVAAARVSLEVAKRNVDDVYYLFLPTLTAQSTATTNSAPLAGANNLWNIQGILSVPIFDGGIKYGNLRNARAVEDEARQTLEALRRTAIVQVEQARRGVDVAEQSRKVAADARALAAETDWLTRAGYIEGQGTSLELVIAASALRQADINLALQEFNLVKARVLALLSLANCPW